ncbi:hypothetical protein IJ135_00885 [Candidatus Saccharibacteria bacterium]|nr:hypothetical protein [Candidatus Saccharibacteria bacterium]
MAQIIHTIKNKSHKTKYNISQTRSRLSPSLRVRRSFTSGRCPADGLINITFGLSKTKFYVLYMVGFTLVILLSGTFMTFYMNETKTAATTGTATQSTISLSLSSNNITLNLLQPGTYDTNNLEFGIFGSASTTASVSTTNYTGYTLSIAATNNNGSGNANNYSKLIDSSNSDTTKNYFSSIESATSESVFSNSSNTSYNGKWGYKPSYYNSSANSNYLPAPSTTGVTIEQTNTPHTTAKDYTITLGARANINQSAGSYSNTFNIVATANPVTYSITYADNSGDSSVANLPSVQASSLNAQSKLNTSTISLSSTIPTRTGYTFNKWCLGVVSNNGTTCSTDSSDPTNRPGTLYSSGADFGIDQITDNSNITLYATWTINKYTCTKRYRLQNADGTFPTSYTADSTEQVNFGATCEYKKTITDYKSSASATNSTEVSASGTMTTNGITLSLDFYRDTYVLTINRNATFINSISGAGTYRWGQSVSISATLASNSDFTTWSQTAGTTSSFGNVSSASTTFAMPKSAATIYANGAAKKIYIQDYTKSTCQSEASSSNKTVYDKRDDKSYTVRYINGNCWMTSDLKFTGTSINPETTNINTTKTISYGDLTSGESNTEARIHIGTNSYTDGETVWYNYAAASAMTIATDSVSTQADTAYDLCPKNWHLPNINNGSGVFCGITNYSSSFKPHYGGGYFGGANSNSGVWPSSRYGFWWSSTYNVNNGANANNLIYNNEVLSCEDNSLRSRGFFVRCVRTS